MKLLRVAVIVSCLVGPTAIVLGQDSSEITRYFRSLRVEPGQTTSDAMCLLCPIYVRGKVDGDALTLGGDIVVEGEVTGDAVTLGGKVVLLSASKVDGDATAIGGEVRREAGATIAGDVDSLPYCHVPGQRSFHIYGILTLAAVNIAGAVLLGYLVPHRRSGILADAIGSHPTVTSVAGVLFASVFVVLLVLAHKLPRIHAPFAVLLTLTTVLVLCCGYAGLAIFAGRILAPGKTRLLTLAVGASLLTVLLSLPIVGLAALLVFVILSLGSVVVSGLGRNADWLSLKLHRRCPS